MPSSYTANLGFELQADGENSSTWGQKVNSILELIEDAISSVGAISMTSDTSKTLTSVDGGVDESRSAVLVVTSTVTLTATRSIIVPSNAKVYLVHNNTSGGQSITVKTSGGTGITISNGKKMIMYCDGTNVEHGVSELPATTMASISLGTDLALVDGGTGASTAADARTNLGVVIGTGVQAWDAALDDLSGLTQDTDKLPYFSSTSSMATTSLTSFARTVLDDTDASGVRTTLGLGALATKSTISSSLIDSDAVTTAKIDSDAVTGSEIADDAVDSEHIANDAVDSEHIANGAIDKAHLSTAALEAAYPIGSIYMNASNSTNPNSLLGFGTWVAFGEGNVTVGYKSGDADFGTAGGTGGAKTHTLTEAEMPEHKHLSPNKDCNSYSGVYGTDAGTVNTWCDTNGIQTSSSAPYGQPKGGDGAHNNLQPYITVYMWNRTG